MKKILIAVDETSGSKAVLSVFKNLVRPPEEVLLLHVERLQGKSLMIDMLSEAELSTLKESMKDTEHKEKLDKKAEELLNYFKKELQNSGLINIRTIIREGIPADEIIKVAEQENVDLIIVGDNGKKGSQAYHRMSARSEKHKTVSSCWKKMPLQRHMTQRLLLLQSEKQ
jgi:nucleotide-binding universal stress UspA family protein